MQGQSTTNAITTNEKHPQKNKSCMTAKIKDSAILVTGQVHSILDRDPPEVEPVAQRLLRYWSDTILKLETTSMQGVRQAILKKPGDEQRSCRFKLGETGIEEA